MRRSGVLLHITALPSKFGIGDMGPDSYRFIDTLVENKQKVWQVLPICQTDRFGCPYSSPSAFGGNHLLISPELLKKSKLLTDSDLEMEYDDFFDPSNTNFYRVERYKLGLFHIAFDRFKKKKTEYKKLEIFCERNKDWINDLAMFQVMTRELGPDWTHWPHGYKSRDPKTIQNFEEKMQEKITFKKFLQYIFFQQWNELRAYAKDKKIDILGDVPIFINHHSMDVWKKPEMFKVTSNGMMEVETGAAPDEFNALGQKWSTPNYNWHQMEQDDFLWWRERMKFNLELFDIVRLDHFRGFVATWEIPSGESLASNGYWAPGPGAKLFDALKRHLGELPIVIEDLGKITDDVKDLRSQLGYPGMRILQFGFNSGEENAHLPHNFPENSVAYTGTHDNDTVIGWYSSLGDTMEKGYVYRYCQINTSSYLYWDFIRLLENSRAATAIVPLQDIMGLGNEARFNHPGKEGGSWGWRFKWDELKKENLDTFKEITENSGRA
ncbi:MAG: 4-alpha-glucanotransferase [Bacteriovoracaceae bacterium]|nr:4-alpha-glucanotransferase [Bacteriovoracaceae bacterium]